MELMQLIIKNKIKLNQILNNWLLIGQTPIFFLVPIHRSTMQQFVNNGETPSSLRTDWSPQNGQATALQRLPRLNLRWWSFWEQRLALKGAFINLMAYRVALNGYKVVAVVVVVVVVAIRLRADPRIAGGFQLSWRGIELLLLQLCCTVR